MVTYLDTNTTVFLHAGLADRISPKAQQQIETNDLRISPMVLLELEMLYEKGKIRYHARRILSDLSQQVGLTVCQLPMSLVVMSALPMKWTRDPGDRLIAAHAHAAREAPLITSDRSIREHYGNTIW